MRRLSDLRIDFMRHRGPMVAVSAVLVVLSIAALFMVRLNMGIDFVGGTQLIVRFREPTGVDELRQVLAGAGMPQAQIQRFGEEERNEVIIKTPLQEGSEEGSRDAIVAALQNRFASGESRPDLNQLGVASLAALLFELDPDGQLRLGEDSARAHYRDVAESIMELRRERGLFASLDDLSGIEGVSPAVVSALRDRAAVGQFAVVSAENVGPQIGSELRTRGVLAVVLSLLGMLAFIWYRFELRFGIGALIASAHDVIVTLGLYALLGYEFNLTTIAAFLTLVGYSVNDSVVIFDRVRENLRRTRREPLVDVINGSLNETLSRTVMTASTTLLAVLALFLLGGDVLRGFAFVLGFGILVGTYSTIYVASAMVLAWERFYGSRNGAGARAAARRASGA